MDARGEGARRMSMQWTKASKSANVMQGNGIFFEMEIAER